MANSFFLGTNILLTLIRANNQSPKAVTTIQSIEARFPQLFLKSSQPPFISVVSVGELHSIGKNNQWGGNSFQKLERLLQRFIVLPILPNDQSLIERYAEIDAFSRGNLTPVPFSARVLVKTTFGLPLKPVCCNLR